MEVLRADYSFNSESFGSLHGMKLNKMEGSKRYKVEADLFLLVFKKDQKSFWRQGKPVGIKQGQILLSNTTVDSNKCDTSAFFLLKIPAQKIECFVNERLAEKRKSFLPQSINEWPELLLKKDSDLAEIFTSRLTTLLELEQPRRKEDQQSLFIQLLNGLFHSVSTELFWALERLKDFSIASRQELLQKVATVNEYMHLNLSENLSLETLADLAGYSHFYFQRQYKFAMGISPTKQLSLWRLEKAIELIRHTDNNLKEIAGLIGYNDLPTFSKAFKREYGISPNKFNLKNNLD
jgi:AraC-like DNA-binding protein